MRVYCETIFKHGIAAMVVILCVFANALGDESDSSKMDKLVERAASGGAEAQFEVAGAYDAGFYGVRSGELAMKYYVLAAKQGHAEAQNSVGSGLQAEEKYSEALVWYQRASEQGHGLATNNLAYLYDLGLGVSQDRQRALQLYSRAADLGRVDAMWNIANMYGAGELGEVDFFNACVWTTRALTYVNDEYEQLPDRLARTSDYLNSKLSSDDAKSCEEIADSWKPSFGKEQRDQ